MTLLRVVARPMLASMFLWGGVNALKNAPTMAAKAKPITDRFVSFAQSAAPQVPIPTDATNLVRLNAAVQVGSASLLATGHFPRVNAMILAGTLVPTTLAGHAFWNESDPAIRTNQKTHFIKNVSMAGGLLMATLDPDPHKKILPRRAKDKVVEAGEYVADSISDLKP